MIKAKRIILSILTGIISLSIHAQRQSFSINDGWKFLPQGMAYAADIGRNDLQWQPVSLPHTWNAQDPFDDDRTYKRGISWYRKDLQLGKAYKGRKVFLHFEGAYQVADVYVNGTFVMRHQGGYTGFTTDITEQLKWTGDVSNNVISVQVNNAHDPFIPPLSIGYALYGGIYRDVWVISTDNIHFSTIDNNAAGVYIKTPMISKEKATITFSTRISNEGNTAKTVEFTNTVYDASSKEVVTATSKANIDPKTNVILQTNESVINNPHLWHPDSPYLYITKSKIVVDGKVADEVINETGFRWFCIDAKNGFSLNGEKLILRGTNRHADMQGKGSALIAEDHLRDMQLIKNMGANFVRLAHYPQSPEVLKLADRLGLLIWEETPVLNYVTNDDQFLHNSENMIQEMIRQGFNHPSIVMWGSNNEILLYSKEGVRIQTHSDTAYLALVRKDITALDSVIRAEDPSRYSTMAMHQSPDYATYKLDQITQVRGYNIYAGWYSGVVNEFGSWLDAVHKRDNKQVIFISEYGAEGEVRLNTEKPVRMDYTGQYQRYYHEAYIRQIRERNYLCGTAIWNEFDFSQPNIGGPAPHMNQKGMVTWNRNPKDVYYLYKANWNPEPMVYIASRNWQIRSGETNTPSTIDVYASVDNVTLTVNGKVYENKKPDDVKRCSWQVILADGKNIITALGKKNGKSITDNFVIDYKAYNANLSANTFQKISINVGSNAQYCDPSGNVWVEDREYTKGSFGYVNSKPQFFGRSDVIKNTIDHPLFYSYLDSIKTYKADVPNGTYKLTLCFAESKPVASGERIFNVAVNGKEVITALDLIATYGFAQAIRKSFIITVNNNEGITIDFNAIKGAALLSGLQIEKE
ncbi:MAG: DUF4982 domain-containing protein [Chitinophagaceae bacterium]|jgi:beta-galactosidase|nr:DUF4982 domain-containing protein [Chitinophagaceae bacterium]